MLNCIRHKRFKTEPLREIVMKDDGKTTEGDRKKNRGDQNHKPKLTDEEKDFINLKHWLLKTGYPLENEVESQIVSVSTSADRNLTREYTFFAPDYAGGSSIRSVDFVASFSIPLDRSKAKFVGYSPHAYSEIVFVIDAKYASTARWWFLPSAEHVQDARFPCLSPVKSNSSYGLSPLRRISIAAEAQNIAKFSRTGRKDNEDYNKNTIADSQVQVLQATMDVLNDRSGKLLTEDADGYYKYNPCIVVPIIVTNASLFLLQSGITSEDIEGADNLESIVSDEPVILLQQPSLRSMKEQLARMQATINRVRMNENMWEPVTLDKFPVIVASIGNLENLLKGFLDRFADCLQKEN